MMFNLLLVVYSWFGISSGKCAAGLNILDLPCIPLADPPYGELTYSEPTTTSYPSRTVATLVCNLGFIASGPTESTCINGTLPFDSVYLFVRSFFFKKKLASQKIWFLPFSGQWQPPTLGTCQQSIFGLGGALPSATSQCLFELPVVANGQIRYSTVRFSFTLNLLSVGCHRHPIFRRASSSEGNDSVTLTDTEQPECLEKPEK